MAIQQGLGGLMPQAPMAGQPVDPRMGAALDVVGADELAEKTDMPLATAALMKRNEALELLKSAENDERAAQFQAPPNPSINDQVNQGLAGMLRSMMPGQALRGRQVQQARARQMLGPMPQRRAPQMAAGLPGLPATNMRRMAANGGVIGYAPGGDVEAEDTGFLAALRELDEGLKADEAERQAERIARGRRVSDYIPVPGGGSYYLPVKNLMYDIGQGVSGLANLMKRKPEEKEEPVDVNALFLSVYDDYTKALESGNEERIARASELVNSFDETTRREALQSVQQNKMMGGKVKGYAGPDGSLVRRGDTAAQEQRRQVAQEARARREAEREADRAAFNDLVALINSGKSPAEARRILSAREALTTDTGITEAQYNYATGPEPTITEYLPNADQSTLPMGGLGAEEEPTPAPTTEGAEEVRAPAPQSFPTQLPENFQSDMATLLERSKGLMALDEEADARRVSDRLAEIMGPTREAQASRRQAQEESRRLRETEFTPEAMRFNRLRAALERGGREGLGGFGAGERAEADRLLKAQIESSDKTAAEFDALVKEMQAMGLNEFQAEEAARQGVRDQVQTGMTVTQAINKTLADISVSEADRAQRQAAQELQARTSTEVAQIQASRPTDFMNEINMRVEALMAGDEGLSLIDARKQAIEDRFEAQGRVAMEAAGIRREDLDMNRLKNAYSMAADKLANRMGLNLDPAAYNREFNAEVQRILAQFEGSGAGGAQPMPSDRSDLVVGTVYNTARGPATWNGTSFEPVQ